MGSKVALVQGASRGIGLQFCRHILSRHSDATVIATCRDPQGKSASGLRDLRAEFRGDEGPLKIVKLDLTNEQEVDRVGSEVGELSDKLDLLINCAGMLHPSGLGEKSLREVSLSGLTATMTTNALGPLLVSKSLAPLLHKGSGGFGKTTGAKDDHKAILVNVSARVGSIGDNGFGGWYSYRMSKAALNMATKNLSIELGRGSRKVVCVALHPGTVDTDLTSPYRKNLPEDKIFTTEYSVKRLMSIVDGLTLDDSGSYLGWDGKVIPF